MSVRRSRGLELGLAATLFFVWLSGSCGSDGDSPDEQPPDDRGEEYVAIDASLLSFVQSVPISDYAGQILDDRIVTFAEYEQAFFAMLQCFQESAVPVKGEPILDVAMHYSYTLTYSAEEAAGVRQRADQCSAEYFEPISRAWGAFKPRDFDLKMETARAWIATCMRGRGAEVEGEPSSEDMQRMLESENVDYLQCLFLAKSEFNLGPFTP
jgi:hypothetical protein